MTRKEKLLAALKANGSGFTHRLGSVAAVVDFLPVLGPPEPFKQLVVGKVEGREFVALPLPSAA